MDTLTLQQSKQPITELPNESTAEQSALLTWHKPTITRIDIKRTMNHIGSGSDFGLPTV